jgi:hypothetical protein
MYSQARTVKLVTENEFNLYFNMFTNQWDFSGRQAATFMSPNTLIYSYISSFYSNSDDVNS